MKIKRRELTVIADEIRIALKSETANILKLGESLVEAKNSRHIKHGQWLPWLTQNFSMSERTAQKYMAGISARRQIRIGCGFHTAKA